MLTDELKRKKFLADLAAERHETDKEKRRRDLEEKYKLRMREVKAVEIDADATRTPTGDIISNSANFYRKLRKQRKDLVDFCTSFIVLPDSLKDKSTPDFSFLSGMFHQAHHVEPTHDARVFQNDTHEFDVIRVSPATKTALERELTEIAESVLTAKVITDAVQRLAAEQKIEELKQKYQVIQHPVTGEYVHHVERVVFMEMKHNPHANQHLCTSSVCVYRPRQPQGVGTMGVSRKVGDVLDQDPREAIASGDHLKGEPPPALRYS